MEYERALKAEDYDLLVDEIEDAKSLDDLTSTSFILEPIVREELKKDGLINKKSDQLNFQLTKKKLVVNGKKQSKELRDKYLKLYTKVTDKVLTDDTTVFIVD